uniref:Uncharacterized protein n=1 Tax=Triticum urartu TaxID=4572 RepID=A0A8R7RCH2_TRIUA
MLPAQQRARHLCPVSVARAVLFQSSRAIDPGKRRRRRRAACPPSASTTGPAPQILPKPQLSQISPVVYCRCALQISLSLAPLWQLSIRLQVCL